MFDLQNFNIIEDDNYYYVFKVLEPGEISDIEAGITSCIRTDRERYGITAKYKEDSEITLEEMFDHIKMHYRHDTNCISFSTSAAVALMYGSDMDLIFNNAFNDTRYVMLRIPKQEMDSVSFFAPKYFIEEIKKIIEKYYETAPDNIKKIIDKIRECKDLESIKKIVDIDSIDSIDEVFEGGLQFEHTTSLDYSALSEEQNLEKNKLIAIMDLLPFDIIPNATNSMLIKTLGSACASMEIIHYKSISQDKLFNCPQYIMDIFSILQQSNNPKAKEIINILINKLINNQLNGLEPFTYTKEILSDEDLSIDKLYEISEGKLDYNTMKNLYIKTYYYAKSKLKVYHSIKLLEQILGSEYSDVLEELKNTFGIESEIVNKRSVKKIKLIDSVGLSYETDLELRLLEILNSQYISSENCATILFNKELCAQIVMSDLLDTFDNVSKEEYYANAIIDSFDWKVFGISKIESIHRDNIIKKLIDNNCVELYHKLKEKGVSEKDISGVLLTIIIRGKNFNLDEINVKDVFTLDELEYFIGYYKLKEADIKLVSYQGLTVSNIEKIFKNRNYSAAILPLGYDKICVAIAEILNMSSSNSKILYMVPNDIMIYQIKKYILEHVIGKANTFGKSFKEIDELIKEIFPNLEFVKYSTIVGIDKERILSKKYDFIIMDELQKTGADNVLKNLKVLFENQDSNTKILGLTTVAMRDSDGIDMTDYWANYFGYSEEEILSHKHLAMNLNVYEAIKLGYVVNPKKVECAYELLRQDGEFDNLSEQISMIQDEFRRREMMEEYDRCRKEAKEADGIEKILTENLQRGKRYVVYCPIATQKGESVDETDGNSKVNGETIIREYIQLLEKCFGKENIVCFTLQGSSSVAISSLARFEHLENDKIKFLLVFDKLNESVSVKNDGIIWFRPIVRNSSILCTKQLENALVPLLPGQEIDDSERPIVLDLTNNLYRVKRNGTSNQNSANLVTFENIIKWMERTGSFEIPSLDSYNSIESYYASILKRIQIRYIKFSKDEDLLSELSIAERGKVKEIIRLGKIIDLWNYKFPESKSKKDKKEKEKQEDLLAVTGVTSNLEKLVDAVEEANRNNWIALDFKGKISKIMKTIIDNKGEFISKDSFMYKWLLNSKNKATLISSAVLGDKLCIYIGLRMGRAYKPWVPYEEALKYYFIDEKVDDLDLYPNKKNILFYISRGKNENYIVDFIFKCLNKGIDIESSDFYRMLKLRVYEGDTKALYICLQIGLLNIEEALEYSDKDTTVDGIRLYPEDAFYFKTYEGKIDCLFDLLSESKKINSEQDNWLSNSRAAIVEDAINGNIKAMFICLRKEYITIEKALSIKIYNDENIMVDGIRLYPEDAFYFKTFDEKIDIIFNIIKENEAFSDEINDWLYLNKYKLINKAQSGNDKAIYICYKKRYIEISEILKIEKYCNPNYMIDNTRLYKESEIYNKPIEENLNKIVSLINWHYVLSEEYDIWLASNKKEIISLAKLGNDNAMYVCLHFKYISIEEVYNIEKYSNLDYEINGKRLYPSNYLSKEIILLLFEKITYHDRILICDSNTMDLINSKKEGIIFLAKHGLKEAMYICLRKYDSDGKQWISNEEALQMDYYKDENTMVGNYKLYPKCENEIFIDNVFEKIRSLNKVFHCEERFINIFLEYANKGNAKAKYICTKILDKDGNKVISDEDILSEEELKEIFSKITYHDRILICTNDIMRYITSKKDDIIYLAKIGVIEAMYICLRKYDSNGKQWISNDEALNMDFYKNKNLKIGEYKLYPKTDEAVFVDTIFEKIKGRNSSILSDEKIFGLLLKEAQAGNVKAIYICLRLVDKNGNHLLDENELKEVYSSDTMVDGFNLYPENKRL